MRKLVLRCILSRYNTNPIIRRKLKSLERLVLTRRSSKSETMNIVYSQQIREIKVWFQDYTIINPYNYKHLIGSYKFRHYSPCIEIISKKKRKLSYKAQLKNADKKAKRRIKKWLQEPQTDNWWNERFNLTNISCLLNFNDITSDLDYIKTYKLPEGLIEIGVDRWMINKYNE